MLRIGAILALSAGLHAQLGYKDTPIIPVQPWHVHDLDRPHPRMVAPGAQPGGAPSDAIVLFDGKDLSKWAQHGKGADAGKTVASKWNVEDGYFEVAPGSGDMFTREDFGDAQIHVEWSEPVTVHGTEVQVLDSYQDLTYADGQAGAIYGQWPPMVNPIRKPGEWNTYDIVFEAPKFEGDKVTRSAFITLLFNGVVAHNRKDLIGSTEHRAVGIYKPHGDEPLLLQDHGHPVCYRNIWVRRLTGYDQPEK